MGRCYSVPEPRDEYREGLRFGTIIVSVCHTGRLLRAPGRGLTQVIREASLRRHPRRFWKAKSICKWRREVGVFPCQGIAHTKSRDRRLLSSEHLETQGLGRK